MYWATVSVLRLFEKNQLRIIRKNCVFVLISEDGSAQQWMSEYCFMSLSAQSRQYCNRRKPEAGNMPYSYFEWRQGFFIVRSTMGSTVQFMYLHSLEHCICTTTMTNIRPNRDSNLVPPGYTPQSIRVSDRGLPLSSNIISCHNVAPLDMKGCVCHFTLWQIHPFLSKGMILWLCYDPTEIWIFNEIVPLSIQYTLYLMYTKLPYKLIWRWANADKMLRRRWSDVSCYCMGTRHNLRNLSFYSFYIYFSYIGIESTLF